MRCPRCGEESEVLSHLRQPLQAAAPAHEVRKRVTIVFSDVTGATQIGEQLDPETLRRVMARYFDRIRRRWRPMGGPDFPRLYGRRNDSESLNRSLEDTLFLGRAHCLGWRRQQVEMLGWALMVNGLTMARHRAAEDLEAAA
jgi:hypothetical protein